MTTLPFSIEFLYVPTLIFCLSPFSSLSVLYLILSCVIGDIFLVKYNSLGEKIWTKQLGTSSMDIVLGLTTDSSGNIYVTGETGGGLDGNTNFGGYDIFLVKFNSDGVKQ